jgi:hypothetical protein
MIVRTYCVYEGVLLILRLAFLYLDYIDCRVPPYSLFPQSQAAANRYNIQTYLIPLQKDQTVVPTTVYIPILVLLVEYERNVQRSLSFT